MSNITKHVLPNGVRILVEPVGHVQSAAVGLWCRTGSRHEFDSEAGITHLIEHMLFKGTTTRTARDIAESIEGRGGSLNAFTDKESTCYYCRVLAEDAANGIEVLSDMMLNSLIEPEELAREQQVVVEEIRRGEDEPSDHVHEVHLSTRWSGHPLGKPIIGTEKSVTSFDKASLGNYMSRRYTGNNVLLAVTGNVDPNQIIDLGKKLLGALPSGGEDTKLERPKGVAKDTYQAKDVEQVHFCIGTDGVSLYDQELYTMSMMDGVLGGGMSSRLFQEIREKRGLVYAIGSYPLSYTAGGAYTVYGGTSPKTWEQVRELTLKEFGRLAGGGLEDAELERNKRNLKGHLLIGLEGMSSRMMRMSRNELVHGRDIPIEETIAKIDAVTVSNVVDLANKILDPSEIGVTAIGPAR